MASPSPSKGGGQDKTFKEISSLPSFGGVGGGFIRIKNTNLSSGFRVRLIKGIFSRDAINGRLVHLVKIAQYK